MDIMQMIDAGAQFKVELTDFNPITSRIDLENGAFDRAEPLVVNDPRINVVSNVLQTISAQDSIVRVRVVDGLTHVAEALAAYLSKVDDLVPGLIEGELGNSKRTSLDVLELEFLLLSFLVRYKELDYLLYLRYEPDEDEGVGDVEH